MADERDRLDAVSGWYLSEQRALDRRLIGYRHRVMRPHFRPGRCLELGPAEGEMTRLLLDDFERVVAVDAARSLLDALPRSPRLETVCALFEEFETAERFDTIVVDHVLEHVADPVQILARAAGWLAPGGRLLAGVPNANSIHRLVAVKMGLLTAPDQLNDRDRALGHRRVLTPAGLRALAMEAGLTPVAAGGVFFKPLALAQIEEHWSDAMIEGFHELGRDFPDLCAEIFCVCEVRPG